MALRRPGADAPPPIKQIAYDAGFGDAFFELTRIRRDPPGRPWVTDFLAGKLFIIPGH